MWRGIVAHRLRGGSQAAREPKPSLPGPRKLATAGFGFPVLNSAAPQALRTVNDVPSARLLVATRPNLAAHLALVARFAALCRDKGIALTVATTPMRADAALRHDPADLRNVVQRLSEVVPLWDFAAPPWLAADIAYWDDPSHFKPAVGQMMLERMFGSNTPRDFGKLRGANHPPVR